MLFQPSSGDWGHGRASALPAMCRLGRIPIATHLHTPCSARTPTPTGHPWSPQSSPILPWDLCAWPKRGRCAMLWRSPLTHTSARSSHVWPALNVSQLAPPPWAPRRQSSRRRPWGQPFALRSTGLVPHVSWVTSRSTLLICRVRPRYAAVVASSICGALSVARGPGRLARHFCASCVQTSQLALGPI